MHMKGEDANIWSSIQLLKRKLRSDRQQLEDIKNDLSRDRSRSLIRNKSLLESNSNEKENQPHLANTNHPPEVSEYRKRAATPARPNACDQSASLIELRKQHKQALKQLSETHAKELARVRTQAQAQISKLKGHYQSLIEEKDSHIRLLEETLAKELNRELEQERHLGDSSAEFTSREQIEAIKEHYESQMQQMKENYEAVIGNLSEENQQLTARQVHTHQGTPAYHNDVTFKNVRMLLKNSANSGNDNAGRLLVRLAQSENGSFMSRGSELAESKLTVNQSTKTSQVDDGNKLYRLFKDKFKFNKKGLQASNIGSSRDSPQREVRSRAGSQRGSDEQRKPPTQGCTLAEVWQSWLGSEEQAWEDQEVVAEHGLMNTIRNVHCERG